MNLTRIFDFTHKAASTALISTMFAGGVFNYMAFRDMQERYAARDALNESKKIMELTEQEELKLLKTETASSKET